MSCSPNGVSGKSSGDTSISVRNLKYVYRNERTNFENRLILKNLSFSVQAGARVLIVGSNGAGKSTLLSVLGGKKIIEPEDSACIYGRPVFADTSLSLDVCYLGEWWRNDYAMDVTVADCMRTHLTNSRFNRFKNLLDVDLDWRISRISDGQRRRCQILANLAEEKSVYIMDEATTDLDIVSRDSLMRVLMEESCERKATILYATHILDNMEGWPTHILYMRDGRLALYQPIADVNRYADLKAAGEWCPLYRLVRDWLYQEREESLLNCESVGRETKHCDSTGEAL